MRFGDTGWAAGFWPMQVTLGGALTLVAAGLFVWTFRLVEGRS